MKALSMTQPWASALFLGLKGYETRSWTTNYRGTLLIHAAKGFPKYARDFAAVEQALGRGLAIMPFGSIIGKVKLVNVYRTGLVVPRLNAIERLYGDYTLGRYAWELADPELFMTPIPYSGHLGLFEVDDDIFA